MLNSQIVLRRDHQGTTFFFRSLVLSGRGMQLIQKSNPPPSLMHLQGSIFSFKYFLKNSQDSLFMNSWMNIMIGLVWGLCKISYKERHLIICTYHIIFRCSMCIIKKQEILYFLWNDVQFPYMKLFILRVR